MKLLKLYKNIVYVLLCRKAWKIPENYQRNLRTQEGKSYTLEEKYQPKIFGLRELKGEIKC